MADILLIQPPIKDFYLTKKRTIPYGLACIASCLIKEGFTVDMFDALATNRYRNIEMPEEMAYLKKYYGKSDISSFALFHHFRHYGYSFEHIGNVASKSKAYLVGICALFTPYINEALKTAEVVKLCNPHCKIVIGGHHPTYLPDDVISRKYIDFVIRGDGELPMTLLAKALKLGTGFDEIPGIVYKKNGLLVRKKPIYIKTLINMPLPALNLIKHGFYNRKKKTSITVVTSRGCPMKCSYCCVGMHSGRKYTRRSVESVINEIERAVLSYNAGFVDFEDENISLNKTWFLSLLSEIIKRFARYDIELRAMNGLFPPSLDDKVIYNMKKAGFKTVNLALASTSSAQLERFQRTDVRKNFDNVLVLAEKYNINAVGYIIAGSPYQTADSSISDLLYLAQRRVLAGISIFYPAPGSACYTLAQKLKILPESYLLMRSSALPVSHSTTRKESVTLLRLARILNFIKMLIDKELDIPCPMPFDEVSIMSAHDKISMGKMLLASFLHDGKIRGITEKNEVYEHVVSEMLTKKFIERLKNVSIKGCEKKIQKKIY